MGKRKASSAAAQNVRAGEGRAGLCGSEGGIEQWWVQGSCGKVCTAVHIAMAPHARSICLTMEGGEG